MIKNYMELLVDEIYNEVKPVLGHCINEECIQDIKSQTLNQLPPKYFMSYEENSERTAFLLDHQRRVSVLAKMAGVIESSCSDCRYRAD